MHRAAPALQRGRRGGGAREGRVQEGQDPEAVGQRQPVPHPDRRHGRRGVRADGRRPRGAQGRGRSVSSSCWRQRVRELAVSVAVVLVLVLQAVAVERSSSCVSSASAALAVLLFVFVPHTIFIFITISSSISIMGFCTHLARHLGRLAARRAAGHPPRLR